MLVTVTNELVKGLVMCVASDPGELDIWDNSGGGCQVRGGEILCVAPSSSPACLGELWENPAREFPGSLLFGSLQFAGLAWRIVGELPSGISRLPAVLRPSLENCGRTPLGNFPAPCSSPTYLGELWGYALREARQCMILSDP